MDNTDVFPTIGSQFIFNAPFAIQSDFLCPSLNPKNKQDNSRQVKDKSSIISQVNYKKIYFA